MSPFLLSEKTMLVAGASLGVGLAVARRMNDLNGEVRKPANDRLVTPEDI